MLGNKGAPEAHEGYSYIQHCILGTYLQINRIYVGCNKSWLQFSAWRQRDNKLCYVSAIKRSKCLLICVTLLRKLQQTSLDCNTFRSEIWRNSGRSVPFNGSQPLASAGSKSFVLANKINIALKIAVSRWYIVIVPNDSYIIFACYLLRYNKLMRR